MPESCKTILGKFTVEDYKKLISPDYYERDANGQLLDGQSISWTKYVFAYLPYVVVNEMHRIYYAFTNAIYGQKWEWNNDRNLLNHLINDVNKTIKLNDEVNHKAIIKLFDELIVKTKSHSEMEIIDAKKKINSLNHAKTEQPATEKTVNSLISDESHDEIEQPATEKTANSLISDESHDEIELAEQTHADSEEQFFDVLSSTDKIKHNNQKAENRNQTITVGDLVLYRRDDEAVDEDEDVEDDKFFDIIDDSSASTVQDQNDKKIEDKKSEKQEQPEKTIETEDFSEDEDAEDDKFFDIIDDSSASRVQDQNDKKIEDKKSEEQEQPEKTIETEDFSEDEDVDDDEIFDIVDHLSSCPVQDQNEKVEDKKPEEKPKPKKTLEMLWSTWGDWQNLSKKEREDFKNVHLLNSSKRPFSAECLLEACITKNKFYENIFGPIIDGFALFATTKSKSTNDLKNSWEEQIDKISNLSSEMPESNNIDKISNLTSEMPESNNDEEITIDIDTDEGYFRLIEFIRISFKTLKLFHSKGFSCQGVLKKFNDLKLPEKLDIPPSILESVEIIREALESEDEDVSILKLNKIFETYFPKETHAWPIQVKVYAGLFMFSCLGLADYIAADASQRDGLIKSAETFSTVKKYLNPILTLGYWTPSFVFNNFARIMFGGISMVINWLPFSEDDSLLVQELSAEYKKLFNMIFSDITESLLSNHQLQNYVPFIKQAINCYAAYIDYAKSFKLSSSDSEGAYKLLHDEICKTLLEAGKAGVLLANNITKQNTLQKLFSSLDNCVDKIKIPEDWKKVNFLEWIEEFIAPYFKL